jgi:hypothetical protein
MADKAKGQMPNAKVILSAVAAFSLYVALDVEY